MKSFKSYLKNSQVRQWISLLAVLAVSVFGVNTRYETEMLLTSLTGTEEHDPFDGTVMPIAEIPVWTTLTTAEYSADYQNIPTAKLGSMPEYRNDYFTFDSADLVWGFGEHNIIRNTKITYSVPYAGKYTFDDCGEDCGSHPGVDIKAPNGTPVYAIANGIVSKAATSGGFGKSIVVKHNDVPDPVTGQETTLYSSYSHLSEFFVTEGQEVHKGEVIGHVGKTGTATNYHLHFQLDAESSPWQAYWPFTTTEATAAGYSFWEAVDAGVGKDNLYTYTRNPMDFVQKYLDEDAVLKENDGAIVVEPEVASEPEVTEVTEVSEVSEVSESEEVHTVSTVVNIGFTDLAIDAPDFLMPGQNKTLTVRLLDGSGNTAQASFDGQITFSLSDSNVAKLNRSFLEKVDFNDGEAELSLYADHDGSVTLTATIASRTYNSLPIYVVSTIEPFAKFGVAHDGSFVPGQAETIQIQALDLSGNPTPGFYGSGTIEVDVVQGDAEPSKDALSKKDFATGIAELTLTASSEEAIVVRVTYGTKEVESSALTVRLFEDLSESDEYYTAVSYLYRKGTVKGYPDGSFKPENTVSRVEALKFIFSGLDQDVQSGLSARFNDTSMTDWYSDYLATAYSLGVVQGYNDGSFKPTQGVNRVEFLKMMFSVVDEISIDPVVMEDPYKDVNALSWYAPYVQYAKENNIFPVSGSYFNPSEPMSRIEVAEVIYRMIAVQQNETSYNSLMRVE